MSLQKCIMEKRIAEVLADMDTDLYEAGASFNKMNEVRKDFQTYV